MVVLGLDQMKMSNHITILGGGLAGLAVGYYAKKKGLQFQIYEANDSLGGNCITYKYKEFLFDSGAHRFQDRDSEITAEVKLLLDGILHEIDLASKIYYQGKLIDFPLSPLNLIKTIGLYSYLKSRLEALYAKLRSREPRKSFEDFTLSTYGNTIATRFLLNYSEKLWGATCDMLSSDVAGKRLKALQFKTFLIEFFLGQKAKTKYLDGSLYYPKMGIGTLIETLSKICSEEHINKNSKITKILHNNSHILRVELNENNTLDVDKLVSTIPLNYLLDALDPRPPVYVLKAMKNLRYRNVVLVALFLNKESVTNAATIYFPDSSFPFTRRNTAWREN